MRPHLFELNRIIIITMITITMVGVTPQMIGAVHQTITPRIMVVLNTVLVMVVVYVLLMLRMILSKADKSAEAAGVVIVK